MQTIQQESVSQHSYWVIFYSCFLAKELNLDVLKVMQRATFHDFDENWNGDISHELKHRSGEIGKMVKQAEKLNTERVISKLGDNPLVDALKEQYSVKELQVVKIADFLSMYMFLKDEFALGNRTQDFIEAVIHVCNQLLELLVEYSELKSLYNQIDTERAEFMKKNRKVCQKLYLLNQNNNSIHER